MSKIRIGMISFAHSHAYSYLRALGREPDVVLCGISDFDSQRGEAVAREQGVPYYRDYRELLAQKPDAVVICSENVHHARLTTDAANAGIHVLCEKPLGISCREMEAMIEACKKNGVQLMTAFSCRYLSSAKAAKAAVQRGEIGEIVAMKGWNRGMMPGGWFVNAELSGGGAILDHSVHVADLMNWMLESDPVEVYALSGTLFNDLEVEDAGIVHIKYANGVIAVLDPSWSRPKTFPTWGDVRLEITGSEGVICIDGFAEKNDIYSDSEEKARWDYWGTDMDQLMIREFVEAIRSGTPVPITGHDGLRSAKVAIAAYESIQTNRPVSI